LLYIEPLLKGPSMLFNNLYTYHLCLPKVYLRLFYTTLLLYNGLKQLLGYCLFYDYISYSFNSGLCNII
jgi:hypothetical protein